jgi:hypothetical protein
VFTNIPQTVKQIFVIKSKVAPWAWSLHYSHVSRNAESPTIMDRDEQLSRNRGIANPS